MLKSMHDKTSNLMFKHKSKATSSIKTNNKWKFNKVELLLIAFTTIFKKKFSKNHIKSYRAIKTQNLEFSSKQWVFIRPNPHKI